MAEGLVEGSCSTVGREAAAAELAEALKALADQLAAAGARPRRVPYGRGTVKRRSPKGFVLDWSAPQLLLPDGRLWHYHTRRSSAGIYYHALDDHARSMHGSIPLGQARFSFLGAVIGKYSFGYRHRDDDSLGFELGAVFGTADSARFVHAAEAFAAIAGSFRS